ncbi:cofilin/actin-depolymerizing factor homolog isoform X1 [Parasteatoda tepidariorum]|uniref:cofilin/actin-depolymerizing factor homolog isoform X1 n=1 Tax=Parasteatoda tepidariorum TaxID=114398 RepID=UPI000A2C0D68|nr:cofilin/actin-depolymerizing factor homolog isoform X1 [Parasteatoda tepidariorum]
MPGPSSGVTVSTAAKTTYEEVKKDKKYRYIIYHIKDEKVIDVEVTGSREATYPEFLEQLQTYKDDCRYCVFDFPANIPVESGQEKSSMSVDRLILMTWCPESAKIKQKMLYSSSYDALKKALVGVYKYVQACDFEEASQEAIEDHFRKGK